MAQNREIKKMCGVCNQELNAKFFTALELRSLTDTERSNLVSQKMTGIGCIACGKVFCHPDHKKTLGFKIMKGYNNSTCPSCGAVLLDHDRLFDLAVQTPPTLMRGMKIAKPKNLTQKLDLSGLKLSLKQRGWINDSEKIDALKADIDKNWDMLVFDLIQLAHQANNIGTQTEALVCLAALGELGYGQLFSDSSIDKTLISVLIETANYKPDGFLGSTKFEDQAAAIMILIHKERFSESTELVPTIISSCEVMRKGKGGFEKSMAFAEVIHSLRFLNLNSEVEDYLNQIAFNEPITISDPNASLWTVNLRKAAGWYAISILANTQRYSKLLSAKNQDIRAALATMLGDIEHPDAKRQLIAFLDDEDSQVVHSAIDALGRMLDDEVIDKFNTLLNHRDRNIRKAVKRILRT